MEAVGAGVGVGAGAVGVGVGAGAVGVGVGVGVAIFRRIPFSITNRPTRADMASPTTKALNCEAVMLTALAQFSPQAATSSQLAKGSLDPLCIKK